MSLLRDEGLTKTFLVENGTILPYRFVKGGATEGAVLQAAAATDPIIGISYIPLGYADPIKYGEALPVISVTKGKPIDVVILGSFPVEFGATISPWQLCTSDAQGRAVPLGATPAAGTFIVRATSGGGVGAVKPVLLMQTVA